MNLDNMSIHFSSVVCDYFRGIGENYSNEGLSIYEQDKPQLTFLAITHFFLKLETLLKGAQS